jgi:hypothetical protein
MVRSPEILKSSLFKLPVSKVWAAGHLFHFLYIAPLKASSCINVCWTFKL